MNLVEYMDPIYAILGETYIVSSDKLEQIKQRNRDASRISRLEMLNAMDEESKENLRKDKYLQYSRRNKACEASQLDDSQPPPRKWTRYPLPLDTNPTPPSTSHKNDDVYLNVDVMNVLAKVIILVPLTKLIKIPSQMDKVRKFLSIEDEHDNPQVVFQTMNYDRRNGGHAPFFITFIVNNLLLNNYILNSRASTNVISLKVMD